MGIVHIVDYRAMQSAACVLVATAPRLLHGVLLQFSPIQIPKARTDGVRVACCLRIFLVAEQATMG